jgi:hypothetical protein
MNTYKFTKLVHIEISVLVEGESIENALDKIDLEGGVVLDTYAGNGGEDKLVGVMDNDEMEVFVEPVDNNILFEERDLVETEDE